MAGIDKIYGNKAQYNELRSWCEKNKPEALLYFYPWEAEWLTDNEQHPITNFPEKIDKWLLKNCTLSWVVKYIKEQYGNRL